jgi:carbamoyltransferase
MKILGVSCDFHDAAAAILVDGAVVAAVQEERFSRIKNDPSLPAAAMRFCLARAGLRAADLDAVAFYETPVLKFERILRACEAAGPAGEPYRLRALEDWLRSGRFDVRRRIAETLGVPEERVRAVRHHDAHAASAFLPSPFPEACVVTLDGVGEDETATIGHARGTRIERLAAVRFPHSLGLFYSAMTAFLGFEVNEGEYKVMGMAAFGRPRFAEAFLRLFDLHEDGTFSLDPTLFDFLTPTATPITARLIDWLGPPRPPESPFHLAPAPGVDDTTAQSCRHYADVAASVQRCTEEVILHVARQGLRQTGAPALCLAGGVALNSLANGRIRRELGVPLHVHPAAGDAGGALGAAALVHHEADGGRMLPLAHAYLGPDFDADAIDDALAHHASMIAVERHPDDGGMVSAVAEALVAGQVVGWFQGRAEWGPRALGNRSILASPLGADVQSIVNEKIKFREAFRPFAPSVPAERAHLYFDLPPPDLPWGPEAFMLAVHPVRDAWRSRLPATTHADGTARVHAVTRTTNALLYALLDTFGDRTGIPVLLNTSFNLRGEPVVNSPADALRTFFNSGMDLLVMGRTLVRKDVRL